MFKHPGDGGPATAAELYDPIGLALDSTGNLYIADASGHRVQKVSPDGIITTVAGGGNENPGNGGEATSAVLNYPRGVAVDSYGDLFIADNFSIREVLPSGVITILPAGCSR